ncbi:hypothetical protein EON64_17675 [archaeon]|nr:MAG: hypothetical protein EON64_17675 [archaeon]
MLLLFIALIGILQAAPAISSSSLKLRYFDARGAAELGRVIMKIGSLDFHDDRFPMRIKPEGGFEVSEFSEAKAAGAFRVNMDRLPILEVGDSGLQIGQSRAIERYISSRCGLLGRSAEESALVDCVAENVRDIKDRWARIRSAGGFAPNSEKDTLTERWFNGGELADWLDKLEKSLPSNCVWAAGDQMSYADICIWQLLRDFFPLIHRQDVRQAEKKAGCGRLSRIADRVGDVEGLKSYLEHRPSTPF